MGTNLYKKKAILNYTNAGTAISSGAVVVLDAQCAIASTDIAASTGTGDLYLEGIFQVAKYATSNALTLNQKCWWDTTELKVYNAAATGRVFIGYAHEAATATATTCYVRLAPFCEQGPVYISEATEVTAHASWFASGPVTVVANAAGTQTVNFPAAASVPGGIITVLKGGSAGDITLAAASGTIGGSLDIDAENDNATYQAIETVWIPIRSTIA